MDFFAAKPAIIIPSKELVRPDRKLILPAISFLSSGRFGSVASPTSTFIGSAVDATNLTTYTFTSQAIGAADATRRVIVALQAAGNGVNRTLSSATIGGAGATIHVQTGASQNSAAFISLPVAAGTTATITATYSGACASCGIGVYRLINETSGSPTDTDVDINLSGADLSVAIDVPSQGSLFAVAGGQPVLRTVTWTGATEQYDAAVDAVFVSFHSGAFESSLGSQTGRTVTATYNVAPTGAGMAVMTWG